MRLSKKLSEALANDNTKHGKSARLVYKWQLVFFVIFWIAFLLYIPIGLAILCPFERLSIDDVRMPFIIVLSNKALVLVEGFG